MISTDTSPRTLQDAPAPPQFHRWLPVLLSVIAGMMDLTGLVRFRLFPCHITGNIVVIAAPMVRGVTASLAQILAVPVFIVGVAATWLIGKTAARRGPGLQRLLLCVHFLLIACVLVLSLTSKGSHYPTGPMTTVSAMMAVLAMACQFALLRLTMAVAPTTAVMTGNLTTACLFVLDWESHSQLLMMKDSAQLRGTVYTLIGFLVGCGLAAPTVTYFGDWAWALPALGAAVAAFGKD